MDVNLRRSFWLEVRHAIGTELRVAVFFLLVGWLGAEYAAHALGGGGQPTVLTHVVAVLFGIFLSYAAVMTVAISAGMRGVAALAVHSEAPRAADAPVLPPASIQLVPPPMLADWGETCPT